VTDRLHAGIAVLAAVFVGATLAVRWAFTPVRDTVPGIDDHPTVETPLAELVGDWPEPATGAVVAQAWRWCAECMRMEPSLLHADDCWRCGHCLRVTYAGAGAAS
jgi:hypothetical protein